MARPIKLTRELIDTAVDEFRKQLQDTKMVSGQLNYVKSFCYKNDGNKATVYFTSLAYAKMLSLLREFSSEIAWHGVCSRLSDMEFLISDIVVYPQEVSGATVEMDELEYTNWLLDNIDDERFDHLFMQGHSHVNMGTTPSQTDLKHQDDILNQINDGYYIFMIWNKRLEYTAMIFDLDNNVLYENSDIECEIWGDNNSLSDFIAEAKSVVKAKTYTGVYGLPMSNGKTNNKSTAKTSGSAEAILKKYGSDWDKQGLDKCDKHANPYMIGFTGNSTDDDADYDAYSAGGWY